MTAAEDLVAAASRSARAAVVVDFDGTISEIVDRPDDARPVEGAVEALNALAGQVDLVAVLSSRPVEFLRRVLEGLLPSVAMIGHSGMERAVGDDVVVHESAQGWIPAVRHALAEATEQAADDVEIEDKHLSFTLHFRQAPHRETAVADLADRLAERHGLSTKAGKMNVEVRPPVTIDKGTALQELVSDASGDFDWLLYAGDDIVDLPAYDGARRIVAGRSFCVAVGSHEAPAALVAAADVIVPGPAALVALLTSIRQRR